MPKQQVNARISDLTRRQLDELGKRWGTTQTETLTVIIDRMYQQETQTMTSNTTYDYTDLARRFGTVDVEVKGLELTFWLTSQAELSNRVFDGWWGDAEEGEPYTAEWSCPAIDMDGNEYEIVWQFDEVKGQEREPDAYPWDVDHITRIRRR